MSADIIRLDRFRLEAVAEATIGFALAQKPCTGARDQVATVRAAFVFARDHCPFSCAAALIEQLVETPCADPLAETLRDSLALSFALELYNAADSDAALDFFDLISDRLFPCRPRPFPAARALSLPHRIIMAYSTADITLSLDKIAGASPYNVRHAEDGDDLTSLKASIRARGMIYRPLVHRDDATGFYLVIDGGRRWRARREIMVEDGHDADLTPFDVTVVSGATPDELIALSTTGFFVTKPLHPVREYEAFAAIAAAHPSEEAAIEAIAKEFGLTHRQVRQKLALGALAPSIRAAWLAGDTTAEAARAYAECPDVAAQEAFFAATRDHRRDDPHSIRKALLGDQITANSAEIRFVGEDAYRAAGGEVRDSLFAEERRFSGTLAKKLAQEKLEAEAERIRQAEGWGFYVLPDLDEGGADYGGNDYVPDYLDQEKARLDALRSERSDTPPGAPRDAEIMAEIDAIESVAMRRAIPAAERAELGIFVDYDYAGHLEIARAVSRAEDEGEGESNEGAESRLPAREKERAARPSPLAGEGGRRPDEGAEPIGKQLRTVLDETVGLALHDVTARNVNAAMIFAVAALGRGYGEKPLDLQMHPRRDWSPAHPLLKSIFHESFDKALRAARAASLADLTSAFCELVAAAIDPSRLGALEPSLDLVEAIAGFTGIESDLKKHFDPASYFRAATKDAAIAMIRDTQGQASAAEARDFKKPQLVEHAALIAKDFDWLPPQIRKALDEAPLLPSREKGDAQRPDEGAPSDTRTTAQAMLDAIQADEAIDRQPGVATDDPLHPLTAHVKRFIAAACVKGEAHDVKASVLLAAFNAWADARDLPQATQAGLAVALHECGFDKHRFTRGVCYLGLGLAQQETASGRAGAERAEENSEAAE